MLCGTDGSISRQPCSSQRLRSSVPRRHAHSEASTSSSIAVPMPTITRKA